MSLCLHGYGGCGWEWTGQDRKSTSKLLQEMFHSLSAVSSVQDDPALFTPPLHNTRKSVTSPNLSLALPSPSTDSTEESILTWLSPMVTHICGLLSSSSWSDRKRCPRLFLKVSFLVCLFLADAWSGRRINVFWTAYGRFRGGRPECQLSQCWLLRCQKGAGGAGIWAGEVGCRRPFSKQCPVPSLVLCISAAAGGDSHAPRFRQWAHCMQSHL